MSPTRTAGLPPVIAWACGALICRMSHWSGDRLSESVAGEFGRSPPGGPEASRLLPLESLTRVAKPAVDEAFSIRLSLSRLARNDALVDCAIATPIWS